MNKLIKKYWWLIVIIILIIINHKLNKLNKTNEGDEKYVYKIGEYYIYIYKNKEYYEKYLKINNTFSKYNFMPKIIFNAYLLIVVEDCGIRFKEYSKKNRYIKNFKNQINNIRNIFEKNSYNHNDIHQNNITVKNDKIYIIDHDCANFGPKKEKEKGLSCRTLPKSESDDIIKYLNDNDDCLNPKGY